MPLFTLMNSLCKEGETSQPCLQHTAPAGLDSVPCRHLCALLLGTVSNCSSHSCWQRSRDLMWPIMSHHCWVSCHHSKADKRDYKLLKQYQLKPVKTPKAEEERTSFHWKFNFCVSALSFWPDTCKLFLKGHAAATSGAASCLWQHWWEWKSTTGNGSRYLCQRYPPAPLSPCYFPQPWCKTHVKRYRPATGSQHLFLQYQNCYYNRRDSTWEKVVQEILDLPFSCISGLSFCLFLVWIPLEKTICALLSTGITEGHSNTKGWSGKALPGHSHEGQESAGMLSSIPFWVLATLCRAAAHREQTSQHSLCGT